MFTKLLSFLCVVSCICQNVAFADEYEKTCFAKPVALSKTFLFAGDSQGHFKGDSVALLSDGSAWKIDARDTARYNSWCYAESVLPQVRESRYWYKGDHKFELLNKNRNESVRTMFIQHPTAAPHIVSLKAVPCDFPHSGSCKHYIELSDGSFCSVDRYDYEYTFRKGMPVYVGCQVHSSQVSQFLIYGTESEAEWCKTVSGKF